MAKETKNETPLAMTADEQVQLENLVKILTDLKAPKQKMVVARGSAHVALQFDLSQDEIKDVDGMIDDLENNTRVNFSERVEALLETWNQAYQFPTEGIDPKAVCYQQLKASCETFLNADKIRQEEEEKQLRAKIAKEEEEEERKAKAMIAEQNEKIIFEQHQKIFADYIPQNHQLEKFVFLNAIRNAFDEPKGLFYSQARVDQKRQELKFQIIELETRSVIPELNDSNVSAEKKIKLVNTKAKELQDYINQKFENAPLISGYYIKAINNTANAYPEKLRKMEEERKSAEEAKKAEEARKAKEAHEKIVFKMSKKEKLSNIKILDELLLKQGEQKQEKLDVISDKNKAIAEEKEKAEEERKSAEETKKAEKTEETVQIVEDQKQSGSNLEDLLTAASDNWKKEFEKLDKAEKEREALEVKMAEEARKAEEIKKAEEAKRAEEEKKKAEEAKKVEEAKRAEEEKKKAEEAKKVEEAKRAEEAKKAEEEKKKAEEPKADSALHAKKTELVGGASQEKEAKNKNREYLAKMENKYQQEISAQETQEEKAHQAAEKERVENERARQEQLKREQDEKRKTELESEKEIKQSVKKNGVLEAYQAYKAGINGKEFGEKKSLLTKWVKVAFAGLNLEKYRSLLSVYKNDLASVEKEKQEQDKKRKIEEAAKVAQEKLNNDKIQDKDALDHILKFNSSPLSLIREADIPESTLQVLEEGPDKYQSVVEKLKTQLIKESLEAEKILNEKLYQELLVKFKEHGFHEANLRASENDFDEVYKIKTLDEAKKSCDNTKPVEKYKISDEAKNSYYNIKPIYDARMSLLEASQSTDLRTILKHRKKAESTLDDYRKKLEVKNDQASKSKLWAINKVLDVLKGVLRKITHGKLFSVARAVRIEKTSKAIDVLHHKGPQGK